jgi:hypothetical protein
MLCWLKVEDEWFVGDDQFAESGYELSPEKSCKMTKNEQKADVLLLDQLQLEGNKRFRVQGKKVFLL